jgi:hypothetical protein
MYYLLFVLFLIIFVLIFALVDKNKDISRLMVLNNALSDDLNGYKSSQSTLIFRLKELEYITDETKNQLDEILKSQEVEGFKVGSIVKWLDRKGEEQSGMVYDDFFSNNVQFVVVRGMRKGDLTGRYFTVLADKIKK